MAEGFGQFTKGIHKQGDTIVSTDSHPAMLAKKGTTYEYLEMDVTSGALKVDIVDASGITVDVNLDNADDDVLIYGFDGTVNRKVKTDAAGELQVDLASSIPTGSNIIGKVHITDGVDEINVVVDGAAAGTTGFHILGTDGTNAQIISVDTTGRVATSNVTVGTAVFNKITDGVDTMAVNTDGSINVVISGASDSVYHTASANLVKDTVTTVVTRAPSVDERFKEVIVSGFGYCIWELQFGVTASEVTIMTVTTTPSHTTQVIDIPDSLEVSSGETIRIRATNKETAGSPSSDFTGYATLIRQA